MSRQFILSCDSTCDLTKEYLNRLDIHYICMHYALNGREYRDDFGESMSLKSFYQAMRDGADTKTSQINTDEFLSYFRPFLEQGEDVFHLTLSSGISGTYNAACIARDMLKEEFPDRKIWIVDSLAASTGFGLLMVYLAEKSDTGVSGDELYQWAVENRLHVHHWVMSTDLTWYVKGGRISKASGWFGTVLNICPVIDMNDEGQLIPRYKLRGKRAAIKKIVAEMKEHANDGTNYSGRCFVFHSDSYEDALKVSDMVTETFPKLSEPVSIYEIGTTIGAHTGPGTVSLTFMGDERVH